MSNLPITSNNPQSPAKDAPGGSPLLRNDLAASGNAASATQENSTGADHTAKTFSTLLARQIGAPSVTDVSAMAGHVTDATNAKIAASDAESTAKKEQKEQKPITANTLGAVAAMLLQIPARQTNMAPLDSGLINKPAFTKGSNDEISRSIEDSLKKAPGTSTQTIDVPTAIDNKQQAVASPLIPLSPVAKQMDAAANSLVQPHSGEIPTKFSKLGTLAVVPNLQSVNTAADSPLTLTTPLGGNGWANEFSQKIVWISSQQNHTAELHLNPPDLGPLNVAIKLSDNQLTAQFTSPHSAVRDAVENALPKLREMLADNNIMLGNATVSDQSPRERSGEGFMNQGSGTSSKSKTSNNAVQLDRLSPTPGQNNMPERRRNGMLDTFA